jgi:ABC-type nitrate/sulfonate/bicarbonate transport system substrate-binding protein
VVAEDSLRERPALVKATVRASLKAHRYMQQNRDGTLAHMARFMELPLEDTAQIYDQNIRYLTSDGLSTPARLEGILAHLRRELGLDRPMTVEDCFDLGFARQANDELDRVGWRP